eukprot:51331-Eustigmatos_ZCMA.PRE.1
MPHSLVLCVDVGRRMCRDHVPLRCNCIYLGVPSRARSRRMTTHLGLPEASPAMHAMLRFESHLSVASNCSHMSAGTPAGVSCSRRVRVMHLGGMLAKSRGPKPLAWTSRTW